MELDLGKKPFNKLTKSALVDILEDFVLNESRRSLPSHKRDEKKKPEKDDATKEADEEMQKTADLAEEANGKASPVEMDEEDGSDESIDKLKKRAKSKDK